MNNVDVLVSQIKDTLKVNGVSIDTENEKFVTIFNEIAKVVSSTEIKKKKNVSIEYINEKVITEVIKYITSNIEKMIDSSIVLTETNNSNQIESSKFNEKILQKSYSKYVTTNTYIISFEKITELKLSNINVKYNYYNINSTNNEIIIQEKVIGEKDLFAPEKRVLLEQGYYTPKDLIDEIIFKLNSCDLIYKYSVNIDNISWKIYITTIPMDNINCNLSRLRRVVDEEPKMFKLSGSICSLLNINLEGTTGTEGTNGTPGFTNLYISTSPIKIYNCNPNTDNIPIRITIGDDIIETVLTSQSSIIKNYSPFRETYDEVNDLEIKIEILNNFFIVQGISYLLECKYLI